MSTYPKVDRKNGGDTGQGGGHTSEESLRAVLGNDLAEAIRHASVPIQFQSSIPRQVSTNILQISRVHTREFACMQAEGLSFSIVDSKTWRAPKV